MEIDSKLVGSKLNKIQKEPDLVTLVFENSKKGRRYVLTFNGILFETTASTLNKKVKHVQINDTLGIRALSQIRSLNRSPRKYRQIYIQMEGSSEENKLELLGALRTLKISNRSQAGTKKRQKS
jgi:hypothetical protein